MPVPRIRQMVQLVLAECEGEGIPAEVNEMEVVLVTDAAIHELNHGHRGKDKPTDVLSFSMLEGGGLVSSHLGSLVISWDTTLQQARRFNVSPEREFLRLVVHGTLHLLGFDHEGVAPSVAAKMRRRERKLQNSIAEFLGI